MNTIEGLATNSTAMVSRLRCSTLSPLSPQERAQRQSEAADLYDRGLITRAEMRAMILGESPAQAAAALAVVAAERLAPSTSTTPTP